MTRSATLLTIAALGFATAQLFPGPRTNPAVTAEIGAPREVVPLLRRACYDCHSNETRWPWYSRVAPVSWLVTHDVSEGRRELNFSEWGHDSRERQARKRTKSVKELRQGKMPPWYYRAFHPAARLTEAEQAILTAWLQGG